jgi:hypothetical protein
MVAQLNRRGNRCWPSRRGGLRRAIDGREDSAENESRLYTKQRSMAQTTAPAWDDVVVAASRQVSSPVGDEVAILGLDQGVYYGLNSTGARIWELVRDPIKVSEIHRTIVEEYDIDEETARKDLLEVLAQLLDAALIEVRSEGGR